MAHEIYGNDSLFLVKTPAWHGLGTVLDSAPNSTEAAAMAFARRDGRPGPWNVVQAPLFLQDGTLVESHKAILRDDTHDQLGIVGARYEPVQPFALYEAAAPIVETGRAHWETGGSLRGGTINWGLLALDPMEIAKGDAIRPYLRVDNVHDGTRSVSVGFTSIRVVCANTLAVSHTEGGSMSFRFRHTSTVNDRLEEAARILAQAERLTHESIREARLMAARRVTKAETEAFLAHVVPDAETDRGQKRVEETRLTLRQALDMAPGADLPTARGTAWGLYNAATYYTSHLRGDDATKRLEALWYGTGADLNETARDAALALAS